MEKRTEDLMERISKLSSEVKESPPILSTMLEELKSMLGLIESRSGIDKNVIIGSCLIGKIPGIRNYLNERLYTSILSHPKLRDDHPNLYVAPPLICSVNYYENIQRSRKVEEILCDVNSHLVDDLVYK